MKKLILATVSAFALGIAGACPVYAANTTGTAAPTAPAQMQTPTAGSGQPATPQSEATNPQTPSSISGTNQYGSSDTANAAHSGTNMAAVSQSDVKQMQQKLMDEGIYHGKIDGMVGPETRQALRSYQEKNGLSVTGSPDQQTMASLLGNGTGVGSSMPPSSSTSTTMPPSSAGTSGTATHSTATGSTGNYSTHPAH